MTLFVSLFTTLLAIINPLEAIPVYLGLIEGRPDVEQRRVARRACIYALPLSFFFLRSGTLSLRILEVPQSLFRVVGGVIRTRVGFDLFDWPPSGGHTARRRWRRRRRVRSTRDADHVRPRRDRHFDQHGFHDRAVSEELPQFLTAGAEVAVCMRTPCLSLIYAQPILRKFGQQGSDAATRIVGSFVAAMGTGLIFQGAVEFLPPYSNVASSVGGA